MEHIAVNTYVALRTSCFQKRQKQLDVFVSRSVGFLIQTYGHGMGHVLDNRPFLGPTETPAQRTLHPEQPLRSGGNELHRAVRDGSKRRTVALLSRGEVDIEEADALG